MIVGDAALELFERLSHRKVFALGKAPVITECPTPCLFVKGAHDGRPWMSDYIRIPNGEYVKLQKGPAVYQVGLTSATYLGESVTYSFTERERQQRLDFNREPFPIPDQRPFALNHPDTRWTVRLN
jgi:hypothetical protein